MRPRRWFSIVLLISATFSSVSAQTTSAASTTSIQNSSGPAFDVRAAVDAYLATVPADQRAGSDAYFEGGYGLLLWDFVSTVIAMWLLLQLRISARMRSWAERLTRFKVLQTAIYSVAFIVLVRVVTCPLTLYEGFVREHQYGLSNQTFGAWMRDQVIMLAVTAVLGGVLLSILFALVRKLGKSWWVWGGVVSVVFLAFVFLISPVFISPLFNTYIRLQDARIRDPILSMARADGIPAKDVYVFDESRQNKRVSANVSGFAGTMRISLNDNLLNRCTLPEIEATMGHEMGHYVLNHRYKGLALEGIVLVIAFAFLNWGLNIALGRWGASWQVNGITDVAVLPLAVLILTMYFFVMTPVENTITRTMEYEADVFGINASQQPDGEAQIDLKLGEYRKLDPGPLEEFVFFDHPSGRTRITAAMRWKAEHPSTSG